MRRDLLSVNAAEMIKAIAILLVATCVAAELPTIWLDDPAADQNERIIKGENANEGEFPYMASLRKFNVTPGHFCGASILTSNWALTAAHCCASIKLTGEFYVFVGSVSLSQGGSRHIIKQIIPHGQYMPNQQWRNDICLVRVEQPFVFTDKVQQITLAPKDWPVNSGDKVTISGWGYTDPNSNVIPDRLQKGVDFIAMSQNECSRVTNLNMFPGYLCAKGKFPGQSTWNGDSGGPLTKNKAQVGLTSFGFRPYGTGKPTVYCRVTNYIDWIKEKLGPDASKLKFAQ